MTDIRRDSNKNCLVDQLHQIVFEKIPSPKGDFVFMLDDNLNKLIIVLDLLRCFVQKLYPNLQTNTSWISGNGANSAIFLLLEAYGCHTVKFQGRKHTMVFFHLTGTSFSFDLMTLMD